LQHVCELVPNFFRSRAPEKFHSFFFLIAIVYFARGFTKFFLNVRGESGTVCRNIPKVCSEFLDSRLIKSATFLQFLQAAKFTSEKKVVDNATTFARRVILKSTVQRRYSYSDERSYNNNYHVRNRQIEAQYNNYEFSVTPCSYCEILQPKKRHGSVFVGTS